MYSKKKWFKLTKVVSSYCFVEAESAGEAKTIAESKSTVWQPVNNGEPEILWEVFEKVDNPI